MGENKEDLKLQLKELIISALEIEDISPSDIDDSAPLFADGLGLDSVDALELGVAIRKKFGVRFSPDDNDNKRHFASVNSLAEFIEASGVVK